MWALYECVVVGENGFWVVENDGRDRVVGLRKYLLVGFENYMEYDVVVLAFAIVIVAMPIASTDMKLHIASPLTTVDFYFGIEHIGPCIGVGDARRDDADGLSEKRLLFFEI